MIIQNPSVLLSEGPAELLERTLTEYADLLAQASKLGRRHLEAVDFALLHHVERLMSRSPEEEELQSAYGELRGMVPVEREEELADWKLRWRAFADLVDARLGALARRQEGVEGALRYAHADRVLSLVASRPGLTQVEIGDELELKPANLSRILGVLEAHELIERRAVGRVKRVHPGRLFPESESPALAYPAHEENRPEDSYLAEADRPSYGSIPLPGVYAEVSEGKSVFFRLAA